MSEAQHRNHHPACQVCGKTLHRSELMPAALVRPSLTEVIARTVPAWSEKSYICLADLSAFRQRYVEGLLAAELGEIAELEGSVVERIARHEGLAVDVDRQADEERSLGQRVADRVASFGGSWNFIGLFGVFMVCWMGLNSWALLTGAFDPYPYILLNLILSCLAALQAPVIMMSQNRQEARDRVHARNDYLINLKAEFEIRLLHEKLDHVLHHQSERLLELQQIQIEMMNELVSRRVGHPRT